MPGDNSFRNSTNQWQGLLLVKVPKAASSTSAGAVLRIANLSSCAVQYHHREGYLYQNHSRARTFLIGSIRQPSFRAFSTVWFFLISPLNITPTDDNVIRALNKRRGGMTKGRGGYQYNYLSLEPVASHSVWSPEHATKVLNPQGLYSKIHQLLNSYHFMLVVERMDESLTALSILLDIPVSHVLVSSAKVVSGSYRLARFGRKKGQCTRSFKEPMSPGVKQYLQSEPWMAMNYADFVLYQAADQSLNKTIQRIGVTRFETALQKYRSLKDYVASYCGERVGSGCTKDGQPIQPVEACYDRDFGCGYQCVSEAAAKYEMQL